MTGALLALSDAAPGFLLPAFFVFLRIGAAMAVFPVFGEMMIPVRVRLAATLAFTAITLPAVQADLSASPMLARSPYLVGAAEVLTGLAIGLSFRLSVIALQIAASIAAQATSLSQLLGGSSVDPQPAIGVVLLLAALALAASMGLHVQLSMMFINSYGEISLGTLLHGSDLGRWITRAVSSTFVFGFALAAPFVAVSLLYNLALGVINRAMPQLMVAFVGAPAITFGALVLLALIAPFLLDLWIDQFRGLIGAPFGPR